MKSPFMEDAEVKFGSGRLSLSEIDAFFRTMPYELDYINADEEYVYYSPNDRDDERLQKRLNHNFLGCHPKRVIPMVKKVVQMLRSGEKDVVESPQVINGHRTLIRYYAIRRPIGEFLGVLEVTEDVEHICKMAEDHVYEHGIVEGKIVDGVSAASINENK